jgi:hypothetical protein
MGQQSQWRFCQQCSGMFFGNPTNDVVDKIDAGFCVNPLPEHEHHHITQGFESTLTFEDGPAPPNTQPNWFFCRKCNGLFFVAVGGDAGVCPKDRLGHDSTGSVNFHLPHNIPETPGDPTQLAILLEMPRLVLCW